SWGYKRVQSPAIRKANRLKNLRIDSVDSVDRGASGDRSGRGTASVLIRKSLSERQEQMSIAEDIAKSNPGSQMIALARKAMAQVNAGEISQFTLNTIMQGFAKHFFDGNMGKMLASEAGKIFLAPKTNRISASENAELMKREGHKPLNHMAQPEGADD